MRGCSSQQTPVPTKVGTHQAQAPIRGAAPTGLSGYTTSRRMPTGRA